MSEGETTQSEASSADSKLEQVQQTLAKVPRLLGMDVLEAARLLVEQWRERGEMVETERGARQEAERDLRAWKDASGLQGTLTPKLLRFAMRNLQSEAAEYSRREHAARQTLMEWEAAAPTGWQSPRQLREWIAAIISERNSLAAQKGAMMRERGALGWQVLALEAERDALEVALEKATNRAPLDDDERAELHQLRTDFAQAVANLAGARALLESYRCSACGHVPPKWAAADDSGRCFLCRPQPSIRETLRAEGALQECRHGNPAQVCGWCVPHAQPTASARPVCPCGSSACDLAPTPQHGLGGVPAPLPTCANCDGRPGGCSNCMPIAEDA